ncbi:MAG: DNA-3-methyladenine glycosylase I [Anaerolineae bacterium]|nr:DNA-3-methyladenine glycosylase I [Anaerolineae bacterium]NUQ04392.1 DNA-3-methyladenine glycosylase I [Anaerolineae bacterium]
MTEPTRCAWVNLGEPLYVRYHDEEWGVPIRSDDRRLFERLCLEGAQAGLSWLTILRKRENYRKAFDGFDPAVVARYDDAKAAALLADAGIVRNRAKIASAINNARCVLRVQEDLGSFSDFLWSFVEGTTLQNAWAVLSDLPAETAESRAMSKALKSRGFTFVGPTICYAMMQATGMINDHTVDCFRYATVTSSQR